MRRGMEPGVLFIEPGAGGGELGPEIGLAGVSLHKLVEIPDGGEPALLLQAILRLVPLPDVPAGIGQGLALGWGLGFDGLTVPHLNYVLNPRPMAV
jgi:hypothetical protein